MVGYFFPDSSCMIFKVWITISEAIQKKNGPSGGGSCDGVHEVFDFSFHTFFSIV